jgi:peptide/nickel transport system ATP-binding protein
MSEPEIPEHDPRGHDPLLREGLCSSKKLEPRLDAIEMDPVLQPIPDVGGPRQPLLSIRGLSKHFVLGGGLFGRKSVVRAVDNVSFEVGKGEVLGIVGESGCGKSTTARLIIGLIEHDSGEIAFDGEKVGPALSLRELRRRVQMVFQDSYASLNPRLTIEDTISFGPKIHGVAAGQARERAHELLRKVGLDPAQFAARYPHELSGGQRQRINIARALALAPRLVVLDEAVSALDKSVEAQVLNLLLDLKEELGLTYIFISHDLNVVRFISDRVIVMYLGEVVESGPVETLWADARHPYTRALLAAMPSLDPDHRTRVAPIAGDPPNPIDPPPGCRFHTRCPYAEPVCSATVPKLMATGAKDHSAACLMVDPASGHSKAVGARTLETVHA